MTLAFFILENSRWIRVIRMYCPCGIEMEERLDYFNFEVYDEQGNPIGFICIHGNFISYGE